MTTYSQQYRWNEEYYDNILFHGRYDPPSAYPSKEVYAYSKMIEALYRNGKIDRKKFESYGRMLKLMTGMDYVLVSRVHGLILPNSTRFVKDMFFEYPHVLLVEGARFAGKTITLWDFALTFLKRFQDGQIYVYNDVDGFGETIMKNVKKSYADRINIMEDNAIEPPVDERKKLVLINEVSQKESSRRIMSNEHLDMAVRTFRVRHTNTWYISANIMHTFFGLDLRNSSDFKMLKWNTIDLAENIAKNSPRIYVPFIWKTLKFGAEDSIVILPKRGKGTYFGVYRTRPPDFLLELHKKAEKNIELMKGNGSKKKEKEWLDVIVRLKKKGYTYVKIAEVLKGERADEDGTVRDHGFRYSYKKVERLYKDWLEQNGGMI